METDERQSGGNGRTVRFGERVRSAVADKLHGAAECVREKVESTGAGEDFAHYGRKASDWLDHSADYVRDLDVQRLCREVESQVKQNPGRSLLIAAVAGLAVGVLFRRR